MRKSCWYFFYAYRGIKRSCKSLVNLLRNISNRKLLSSTMRPFGLSWKLRPRFTFSDFFFFSLRVNSKITWFYCAGDKKHCVCTVHGSHNTIHTFKNYFVTVFSVFSFSNNKFNPNEPNIAKSYTIYNLN